MENIRNTYSFENHPVLQTIKLRPPDTSNLEDVHFDLLSYSNKIQFTEPQLFAIYNLLSSTETLENILKPLKIELIFNFACLNRIIQVKEHNDIECYYILHSALSFCVSYSDKIDIEDLYLILNSLAQIKKQPYHVIAINMVSYILFVIAQDIRRYDVLKILEILRKILNANQTLPRTIVSAIIYLMFIFGSRGPIDSSTEALFMFLSELDCYSQYSISDNQAVSLFDRVYYGLCSLNISSMTLMNNFITKIPWGIAELYFSKIGYIVANFIHQKHLKYLHRIYPVLNDKLRYTPLVILDCEKKHESLDDCQIQNTEEKNYDMTSSNSFSNMNDLPADLIVPCFDLSNEEDLSAYKNLKIDISSLDEPFKLHDHLNSMIIHKFYDYSPFEPNIDSNITNPKFNIENFTKHDPLTKTIVNHVSCIVKLARNYPKAKATIYRSFIKVLKSYFDLDVAYSLVLFLSLQSEITSFEKLTPLFVENVFSPKFTIFDAPDKYERVLRLRFMYFSLLLKWGNFDILSFIDSFKSYPLMIAELCNYIINRLDVSEVKLSLYHGIIDFIINVYPSYINEFDVQNTSKELIIAIRTIFELILHIFWRNLDFAITLMEQDYFISYVFSLYFDKNIRLRIQKAALPAWLSVSHDALRNFAPLSALFFDFEKESKPDYYIKMLTDFLNHIVDIIEGRSEPPTYFIPIQDKICPLFAVHFDIDTEIDFAIASLKFLTVIAKVSCLNVSERSVFLSFLEKLLNGKRDNEIFKAHSDLIIGHVRHQQLMQISQPKYLYNFYALFGEKAIDFLQKSFEVSPMNRLMCHLGQIDIKILEEFEEMDEEPPELLESFFIDIAKVASNMRVVYRIISLMSQKHIRTCMRILVDCLIYKVKYPVASLPLKNDFDLLNISRYNIGNGPLNVMMWYLFTVNTEKTSILKSEMYDEYLEIYMDKKVIEIKTMKAGGTMIQTHEFNVKPNQWNLIVFSFLLNKLTISTGTQTAMFDVGLDVRYNDEMIIGFKSKDIIYPFFIGPIMINYDEMTNNEIHEIIDYGPRVMTPKNSILIVSPDVSEDHVCLQKIGDVTTKITMGNLPGYLNFADVFIRFFTAQVLIPLFQSAKNKTDDILFVISTFRTLFYVSPESQELFSDEHGWQLVSYLMKQLDKSIIDINIYLAFYDIFTLAKDVSFKQDLLKNILVNPLIWIYADTKLALMVTHHWFSDLFLMVNIPISFTHFLGVFLGTIWKASADKVEALTSIQDQAVKTLVAVAEIDFDEKDFDALINTIVTANDNAIIINMIELLQDLAMSPKQILFNVSDRFKSLSKVTTLFEKDNEDITLAIFKLMSVLQASHIFKTSLFVYQIESFNYHYADLKYSTTFLDQVYNLKDLQPDFIQVCFAIISYNTDLAKHFLEYLEPNSMFAYSKAWSFWPIIAATNMKDLEDSQKIFEFVLNCTNKDWECAFLTVMIVAPDNCYIRQFLTIAAQKIRLLPRFFADEQISTLLNLCMFYILFRRTPYINDYFNKLYGLEQQKSDEKEDFISKLEQAKTPREYTYGINFHPEDGRWVDVDLAITCVEIIICIPSQEYNDLGALYAAFALSSKGPDIMKIITIFLAQHKPSASFMQLLASHMKRAGSTIPFSQRTAQQLDAIPNLIEQLSPKVMYYTYEMTKLSNAILQQRKACMEKKISADTYKLPFSNFILENVFSAVDTLKRQTAFQWRRFWMRMTSPCAPWEKEKKKDQLALYKRDSTICSLFCPMKSRLIDESEEPHTNYFSRTHSSMEFSKMDDESEDDFSTSSSFSLFFSDADDESSSSEDDVFVSKVLFNDQCTIIKIDRKHEAVFNITKSAIVIDYMSEEQRVIPASNISDVLCRYFYGYCNGLEIFNYDGESILIKLHTKSAKEALKTIVYRWEKSHSQRIQRNSNKEMFKDSELTEKWVNRQISNFEYLMSLNHLSGRSFHCESSYPIMPWVFKDYNCDSLEKEVYRDTSLPFAAQSEANREILKKRETGFKGSMMDPFYISYFSLREEPFTTRFFNMKFKTDPGKLFNSIPESARIAQNNTDTFIELTPEFFFDHNIFTNTSQLETSNDDTAKKIQDVTLPPWAKSPLDFVYQHRKALEKIPHLEKWIDLVWGVNSRGKEGENFFMKFDEDYYTDSPPKAEKKLQYRKEDKMHRHGQNPPMMFDAPHPAKIEEKVAEDDIISFSLNIENVLLAFVDSAKQSITYISSDGVVYSSDFQGEAQEIMKFDISIVQSRKGKFGIINKNNNIIMATKLGSLLSVDTYKKTTKKISAHFSGVNCISSSSRVIASGGDDTRIYAMTSDTIEPLFSVATYDDEVTCCHVSQNFHTVITCTHCGNIFSIDSRRREITWKRSLCEGAFPLNVIVTNIWGFIVIHYTKMVEGNKKDYITVMTIDGNVIQNFEVDFSVTSIERLSSKDGFDYVVLASENGKLYCFETYFGPKKLVQFGSCNGHVICLNVSEDSNSIYIITNSGKVQIIPTEIAIRNSQI